MAQNGMSGRRAGRFKELSALSMRLRPQSRLARMLAALFWRGNASCDALAAVTGAAYANTYLWRAKRMNLVRVADGAVCLSEQGRWYCLAASLGVTFSELCILSDMYYSYMLGSGAGVACYVKRHEIFDAMQIAEGTADKILHSIVRKGHAMRKFGHGSRYDPAVMYLAQDTREFLLRHERDILLLRRAVFHVQDARMQEYTKA